MKSHLFFCSTLVLLVIVAGASAEKKDMGPKKQLPDDKLFQDQAAFCEGCYGMIHETHKLLTLWSKEKGSLEDHIDSAMIAVCSTDRLRAYVLSPPKMERLCSGIRAHYEDELGTVLMKNYQKKKTDVDNVFADACKKVIPACPKNMKPMSVNRKEQREKDASEKAAKEAEETKGKDDVTRKEEPKKTEKKRDTKNQKKGKISEVKGSKKDEL